MSQFAFSRVAPASKLGPPITKDGFPKGAGDKSGKLYYQVAHFFQVGSHKNQVASQYFQVGS